ncbi:MAG: DUF86 domain-containing protein [Candidatus Hydrogenedentes bacterium]|nr:DUF86 domain-containing protein [Candidatus Hydrogenedentota bacterium]
MNDVLLAKKASLERCIAQVKQYYREESPLPFEEDHLRQDAICLNLQRACQLAVDMANHVIRVKKLGLPQDSRDAFVLVERAGLITAEQSQVLQGMVGFRNVLVHDYRRLDLGVLVEVIEHRVEDLLDFSVSMLTAAE